MTTEQINIGDRITFKSPTRWGYNKVTRVVKNIGLGGRPEVAYGGWSHFIVHLHEISKVERAKND